MKASVIPQLSVRRGRTAVESYKEAFGAVEVYRVGGTEHHEAVVARLEIGSATFWVADESPEHSNFSPGSVGGSTTRMPRVVDDPEATVLRAVDTATPIRPVVEERRWRLGRVADPSGHHWDIGRPLIPSAAGAAGLDHRLPAGLEIGSRRGWNDPLAAGAGPARRPKAQPQVEPTPNPRPGTP